MEGVCADAEIRAMCAILIGQRLGGKRMSVDDDAASAIVKFLIHHVSKCFVVLIVIHSRNGCALLRRNAAQRRSVGASGVGKSHALFGHGLVCIVTETLHIAHKATHGEHQHIPPAVKELVGVEVCHFQKLICEVVFEKESLFIWRDKG